MKMVLESFENKEDVRFQQIKYMQQEMAWIRNGVRNGGVFESDRRLNHT